MYATCTGSFCSCLTKNVASPAVLFSQDRSETPMNSRWFSLYVLGAAILGWLLGQCFPDAGGLADALMLAKTLFLSALKLIVGPLVFCAVITGIWQLRAAAQVQRLGLTTLAYYFLTTAIAIAIGLVVVLFIHPWTSSPPLAEPVSAGGATLLSAGDGSPAAVARTVLARLFDNPVHALAELNILGIVANALILGVAGLLVLPKDSRLEQTFGELMLVLYRVAAWATWLVPVGVLAITFEMSQQLDGALLGTLLSFVAVVFGATMLHGLVILPVIGWLASGHSPLWILRRIGRPMLVAFSTSSSAATLPVSLATAQQRLGVRASVAGFVLPLGATINMDGTALFEGIAAIFLAYLFGIDLGVGGTIVVFLVAMLASVGAPGMPSGSMAGMQVVLLAVGIPLEAIGLLLLIERPLDTFRTAVNVEGDLIATLVAERFLESQRPTAPAEVSS